MYTIRNLSCVVPLLAIVATAGCTGSSPSPESEREALYNALAELPNHPEGQEILFVRKGGGFETDLAQLREGDDFAPVEEQLRFVTDDTKLGGRALDKFTVEFRRISEESWEITLSTVGQATSEMFRFKGSELESRSFTDLPARCLSRW